MRSSKWHANGNVYVLVEPDEPLDAESARAQARGTDGVLEIVAVDGTEAEIVIWNPDGSRAEMSGNGTRIAAAWLAERAGADSVRVRTGGRVVAAQRLPDGRIEQELGELTLSPQEVVAGVLVTPVSVGNPHAVVEGDPDSITRLGPLLETHPRFPQRTNVQVARVEGPGRVTARVWERGVGETQSSGTSAVAVAAATHGEGQVRVTFPGGDLEVRLADGRAWLTGPAERLD
jgi:diaminopimelate epimerase